MEVSSWENHLYEWALASMAMLNNQRVGYFEWKNMESSSLINR